MYTRCFFVKSKGFGDFPLPLKITRLDEAVSYIQDNWANAGTVEFYSIKYKAISKKVYSMNTDYAIEGRNIKLLKATSNVKAN